MIGSHCFRSWSRTQAIIALSSGEAEYYGCVKACSVALGAQALYRDMGVTVKITVLTDAEAAKGIISRSGLGQVRHLSVYLLWAQERVRNGDLAIGRVKGTANPADLCTKHVARPVMEKLMTFFGFRFQEGRSALTPQA